MNTQKSPKIARRSPKKATSPRKRSASPKRSRSPKRATSPKRLTVKKTRVGKVTRNNIKGFTNGALKRLAHKAGVPRVGKDAYDAIRAQVLKLMEDLIRDTNLYRESARRKTIMKADFQQALGRKGITYAG